MHEVTHISYGSGAVEIVLDSASLTEVTAPNFRFGDYPKAKKIHDFSCICVSH